ncbi:MAG: prepilin-type N-terminal cleavage/methylation domain-containing protein [Myxococcota bacterium]
MKKRTRLAAAAFTLLEVMIAVGILSVGLTAIFSSQGQAIKVAHRARKLNIATLLARCKMGEVEEDIARDGLPAVDDSGSDECCEGAEVEGFRCEWSVRRVVLPDGSESYTDDEEGEEGGAAGALANLAGGDEGDQTAALDGMLAGAGGLGDAFTELAIGIAFPVLKPSIEEQVRRASVVVQWKEGDADRNFEVVQYLVAEQPPADPTTGGGS